MDTFQWVVEHIDIVGLICLESKTIIVRNTKNRIIFIVILQDGKPFHKVKPLHTDSRQELYSNYHTQQYILNSPSGTDFLPFLRVCLQSANTRFWGEFGSIFVVFDAAGIVKDSIS